MAKGHKKSKRKIHRSFRSNATRIEVVPRPEHAKPKSPSTFGFWDGTGDFGSGATVQRPTGAASRHPLRGVCVMCSKPAMPGEDRCYTCAQGTA